MKPEHINHICDVALLKLGPPPDTEALTASLRHAPLEERNTAVRQAESRMEWIIAAATFFARHSDVNETGVEELVRKTIKIHMDGPTIPPDSSLKAKE